MPGLFTIYNESLKSVLSQFKETYMLLMEYPFIRGEYLPDYAKKATWNLLHTYIDVHSQRSIDEYPKYGVQSISRMQCQCAKTTFTTKADILECFSK